MSVEMALYSQIFNNVCKSFSKAGSIAGLGLKYIKRKETKEKVSELTSAIDQIYNELKDIHNELNFVLSAIQLMDADIKSFVSNAKLDSCTGHINALFKEYNDILNDYTSGKDLENINDRIDKLVRQILSKDTNLFLDTTTIYDAMVGHNVSGSTLELWTKKLSLLVTNNELMDCYLSLEGYLDLLVYYQLIATNLVIEAKNYLYDNPDDPDTNYDFITYNAEQYLDEVLNEYVKEESEYFTYCVEYLAASAVTSPETVAATDGVKLLQDSMGAVFYRGDFVAAQLDFVTEYNMGIIVRVMGEPATVGVLGNTFSSGAAESSIVYTLPCAPNTYREQINGCYPTYNSYTYTQWMNGYIAKKNNINTGDTPPNEIKYFNDASTIQIARYYYANPVIGQNYVFQIPYGQSTQAAANMVNDSMEATPDGTGILYGNSFISAFNLGIESFGDSKQETTDDVKDYVKNISDTNASGSVEFDAPFNITISGKSTGSNNQAECSLYIDAYWMKHYVYTGDKKYCRVCCNVYWNGDDDSNNIGVGLDKCYVKMYTDGYNERSEEKFHIDDSDGEETHPKQLTIEFSEQKDLAFKLEIEESSSKYMSNSSYKLDFHGTIKITNLYFKAYN